MPTPTMGMQTPPIVYTIAGSDSGGGAGIQADLHAIHAMKCHGCSAITCLTAQNSVGVTAVHAPDPSFLQTQLETLLEDLPPHSIKIGMLGTRELAETVGKMLRKIKEESHGRKVWIVLDPVMISTSGSKLLEDDAIDAMIQNIFPLADIITPNKFEAEALLKRELKTPEDIETAAKELLETGCGAVLIKGGHTLIESKLVSSENNDEASTKVQSTLKFAQDYLLTAEAPPAKSDERLCDGCRGVWLRTPR
jgi:hydroxymethylpyrimidine kinase/phosphomethylpyrimidine kinase